MLDRATFVRQADLWVAFMVLVFAMLVDFGRPLVWLILTAAIAIVIVQFIVRRRLRHGGGTGTAA